MVKRSRDDASTKTEYAGCFCLCKINVIVLDVELCDLIAKRGLDPVGVHGRRGGAAGRRARDVRLDVIFAVVVVRRAMVV